MQRKNKISISEMALDTQAPMKGPSAAFDLRFQYQFFNSFNCCQLSAQVDIQLASCILQIVFIRIENVLLHRKIFIEKC